VGGLKNTKQKYFIALVLDEPEQGQIIVIKQELLQRFDLRGALRSPAHITLHRPFEWREDRESDLLESLSAFEFGERLDLQIKDFGFFEPRVVFAAVQKNEALNSLHLRLVKHCKEHLRLFNESEDLRGFHPHITIAFRDLKKPLFYSLQKEFNLRQINFTAQFSGFALLKLHKTWEVHKIFK
jgi:2'-5' RNA ligase